MAGLLSSSLSAFVGTSLVAPKASTSTVLRSPLTVEAAHKKGTGSSKNGRDSNAQRLGVKVYGDQPVKAGGIIIRQRGYEVHCGPNTFVGKDYTVHAAMEGTVRFYKKKGPKTTVMHVTVEETTVPEYDKSASTRRNAKLAKYPPRA